MEDMKEQKRRPKGLKEKAEMERHVELKHRTSLAPKREQLAESECVAAQLAEHAQLGVWILFAKV